MTDKNDKTPAENNPSGQERSDDTGMRPELAEMIDRHAYGLDENRPGAVERRQQKNQRTARANVADLLDADSFIEYGALAVAAQRGRRAESDLIEKTPADGMIAGIGSVNAGDFPVAVFKDFKKGRISTAEFFFSKVLITIMKVPTTPT